MKYTQEQKNAEWDYLQQFRNKEIAAVIKSVSSSGMSRRIEFYADGYNRIGYSLAVLGNYSYNDKGLRVDGCGMDMIFSVLSKFNYFAAQKDTGKTIQELLKTKECGERIYDKYFFNANNYRIL